ncbi:choice-of-anchor K domain-containing protein [Calothrix sp. CCY 0018]|uniref:choice-of-anchor K domain-containing protein n=1 Tax=Calothrix sp. CCY 0018 TaxID=3103864 RepID=UPI0039C5D754
MKLNLFFSKAVFPVAIAALSVIGFSPQAEAAVFSGKVIGSWGMPTPGEINDNPTYTGVGTNVFTWGDPTLFEGASANQLVFEGSYFSTDAGSLFKIGDLTYHNGTVLLGTSVESVPLNLDLIFSEPPEIDEIFDYGFSLQNTPNLSEDPESNADFLFVVENDVKRSFTYGGNKYTLSLAGFSQDNGKTQVKEFRALEGGKTTASVFARIDKVTFSKKEVPEPGLAVGLSVLGFYLISRTKAKKA